VTESVRGAGAAPFGYARARQEQVACNLCLRRDPEVLARRDRNGLRVRSCICRHCGLIYLDPRMTREWYDAYYATEYRRQMAAFKGVPARALDPAALFDRAAAHGRALAKRFEGRYARGLTIEVGSSVGGVLDGLARELDVEVLGIEPSPDESAHARSRGIETITASIESLSQPLPPAANIVCTQSLNHFLDPRAFFEFAHRTLQPDGKLVLEVMNFRHVVAHYGWIPRAVQIDHTYMFVPEVLRAFVEAAGFEIERMEVDAELSDRERALQAASRLPGFHAALAARRIERQPFDPALPIPALYESTRASLAALPNDPWLYFRRFGFSLWRRRLRERTRSRFRRDRPRASSS
jgi:SAM-dependent methyltransferase